MDSDKNDDWLRDIVRPAREVDRAHTPSFERIWRAAERRSAQMSPSRTRLVPRLALGFAAVTVSALVFWKRAEAPDTHGTERDLAALDSVLVTYWEAPSDILLEPLSPESHGRVQ